MCACGCVHVYGWMVDVGMCSRSQNRFVEVTARLILKSFFFNSLYLAFTGSELTGSEERIYPTLIKSSICIDNRINSLSLSLGLYFVVDLISFQSVFLLKNCSHNKTL